MTLWVVLYQFFYWSQDFSQGTAATYLNEIFKHPATLFEIAAPSRGLIILVSFVNIIQDKCNFIFQEFVGYNQRNLPKDLKKLMGKKNKSEFKPKKLCFWWTGKQKK